MSSLTTHWNPESYARDAGFVARLGEPLLDLLAARTGERILDLGCGDGALTVKLQEMGADVLGVDASVEQVHAARARGLRAEVMDGQALTFERAFEAVFSNAALHWMKRKGDVLQGIARALVPGGRFVAEFGGAGNVQAVREALAAALAARGIDAEPLLPWYFPDVESYRALLVEHGFVVQSLALFARPTPLPGDVTAWLRMFAQSFLAVLPAAEVDAFLQEVRARLVPRLRSDDGRWSVDYVRLRLSAFHP